MNVVHVMQDGTVRESIEGVVIKSKEFYAAMNLILQDRNKRSVKNDR